MASSSSIFTVTNYVMRFLFVITTVLYCIEECVIHLFCDSSDHLTILYFAASLSSGPFIAVMDPRHPFTSKLSFDNNSEGYWIPWYWILDIGYWAICGLVIDTWEGY